MSSSGGFSAATGPVGSTKMPRPKKEKEKKEKKNKQLSDRTVLNYKSKLNVANAFFQKVHGLPCFTIQTEESEQVARPRTSHAVHPRPRTLRPRARDCDRMPE